MFFFYLLNEFDYFRGLDSEWEKNLDISHWLSWLWESHPAGRTTKS